MLMTRPSVNPLNYLTWLVKEASPPGHSDPRYLRTKQPEVLLNNENRFNLQR